MAAELGRTLQDVYGVRASYDQEHPGLWLDEAPPRRKIASVGMRVHRGVTTHGVAINLTNSMEAFSRIVPCGMPSSPLCRLQDVVEDGGGVSVEAFREAFLFRLSTFLGAALDSVELELPQREDWALPVELEACVNP